MKELQSYEESTNCLSASAEETEPIMAEKRAENLINLSGNEYAKVAERIKLFREDNPKGKIDTQRITNEDGSVEFRAWVWKDKSEMLEVLKEVKDLDVARGSSDSNGSSKGEVGKKVKDYEKLETIAVGRALANLGYLASGEVASADEMEEYLSYKHEKKLEQITEIVLSMEAAKTIDELKKTFIESGLVNEPEVIKAKDRRKAELLETKEKAV